MNNEMLRIKSSQIGKLTFLNIFNPTLNNKFRRYAKKSFRLSSFGARTQLNFLLTSMLDKFTVSVTFVITDV